MTERRTICCTWPACECPYDGFCGTDEEWGKELFNLGLCKLSAILHMSFTGASDPLSRDEFTKIRSYLTDRVANWKPSSHAKWKAYDDAIMALVKCALAEQSISAPVPAPSAVRAPAVVAAQGVTEEEVKRFDAVYIEVWDRVADAAENRNLALTGGADNEATKAALEDFAATRAQQGGEDARDARRYRWLRKQHWSWAEYCVVRDPKNAIRLGHSCPSHDLLDEAIDAAIAAKEGKGND